MSKQTPYSPDGRNEMRHRVLAQAVLRHLEANGPTGFMTLYSHFDAGNHEIGSTLGHLARCHYIAMDDTRLKITGLGTAQLDRPSI
jgi:hypothetical protein